MLVDKVDRDMPFFFFPACYIQFSSFLCLQDTEVPNCTYSYMYLFQEKNYKRLQYLDKVHVGALRYIFSIRPIISRISKIDQAFRLSLGRF